MIKHKMYNSQLYKLYKKMYLQEYKLKKLITNQKSITHTRPTPKSKLK